MRAVGQPRVASAEVIGDDVEHDLEALLVGPTDELLKRRQGPQMRIDRVRVKGPVAVIPAPHLQGDRRDPYRGHAKTLDVVELVDHALQIAALPPVGPAGNAVQIVRRVTVAEPVCHHHVDRFVAPIDRGRRRRRRGHQARDDNERRQEEPA